MLRPVHGRLLVEQKAQMWRSSEREGAPEFTIYYFTNVYGGLPDEQMGSLPLRSSQKNKETCVQTNDSSQSGGLTRVRVKRNRSVL